MATRKLEEGIRHMYASMRRLREAFPAKPFTPDGRMVGDIGEAIAALRFNVTLDERLRKHWDGYREIRGVRRDVQIKTTQKDSTYLKQPPHEGDLLVFKFFEDGRWKCCYDGPIQQVWDALDGQRSDHSGAKFVQLAALQDLESIKSTKGRY